MFPSYRWKNIHLKAATAAAAAKLLQSFPTLCDPIDSSPPGSSVPGILQARTLEWVAISFSNAWKWKVKVKSLSRVRLFATPWTVAHQALRPWDFPGKSTGVGCHFLLHHLKAWDINSSLHSLWQKSSYHYKYRHQKEFCRLQDWALPKAGVGYGGVVMTGWGDGVGIKQAKKKTGKEESEWETGWKNKEIEK